MFLLAIVVYSTIWCVQAVGWVSHLNILSLTTALGLIIGVIAAKQRRIPRFAIHLLAISAGVLIAFWQTAGADYAGNVGALANGMHQWVITSLAGNTSEDDSIFLFFITTLGFVLAYTSTWLVYRTRIPWLMIVANAVVLLINLSNTDSGYIIFLVVFLMASLLLVLRLNLYESFQRWRKQGLRYSDDVGWDVMQAGILVSIGILVFSWLLPWGYTNDAASQVWSTDANPWVQLENTWNRVISLSGGENLANHGNFRDTLVLGGNPNLNTDTVFRVQSDDETQYLASLSYETYDGRGWRNGAIDNTPLKAHDASAPESIYTHGITQNVTVVNPPGEQYPYLFGASQIASTDQPIELLSSHASLSQLAVLRKNGRLVAGDRYTVSSYVSAVDVKTLRTVPLPVDSPRFADNYDGQLPPEYYSTGILNTYLQVPHDLDPNILAKAREITANAPTMYDKAAALESYFHTFQYDVHIQLPPGEEGVSWFLFRSGQRGFCNYFSTSMTVMARMLGMPARVVVGYTNGEYDPVHHQRVIHGSDAHSWTQIYFAGYGWINFEPSAGFSSFNRPLVSSTTTTGIAPLGPGGTNTKQPNRGIRDNGASDTSTGPLSSAQAQAQAQLQLRQQAGFALGGFIVLLLLFGLLFIIWWRRLFQSYRFSSQIYERLALLANWAGIN
ncbi:MAG: DUF3488 and transglutaminase-like domain-containing protein, partial [Chloroflexota bacterium]|nr:DUF3488 and transglutaminase-like domain-containing protein [Chloroflexota bacterium]